MYNLLEMPVKCFFKIKHTLGNIMINKLCQKEKARYQGCNFIDYKYDKLAVTNVTTVVTTTTMTTTNQLLDFF